MVFWDRAFIIEGMVRKGAEHPAEFPEEEMKIDEKMILRRCEIEPGLCTAHLLVETAEDEHPIDSHDGQPAQERVFNLICVYSLFSGDGVAVKSAGATQLRGPEGLGTGGLTTLHVGLVFTPEAKEREEQRVRKNLSKSNEYFSRYERVLLQKPCLANALHYFYYAVNSKRREDVLIDLIIALESLYMREREELRYRLSLRVAALIGEMYDDRTPIDVFEDIKQLYDKRSRVLHGKQKVEISFDEIQKLKDYARCSIKIISLLLEGRNKEEILKLIDRALISPEAEAELRDLARKLDG